MKSRPRRAEREIACHFSEFYKTLNLPPVERIPVIGRTGPDLTINDFGLVVDVKSRKEVPESYIYIHSDDKPVLSLNGLLAVKIGALHTIGSDIGTAGHLLFPSTIVKRYLEHMDEWTKQHRPDGISAIVLHKPKLPFGESVVVIFETEKEKFHARYSHYLASLDQLRTLDAPVAA